MDFVNSGVWSFGDMMKTIVAKSETAVQTYRRDLKEFGAGLREETAALRNVLRSLPGALDNGAAAVQESLESLGQAVDDLGNSVRRRTLGLKKALFDDHDDALCGAHPRRGMFSDLGRVVGDGVEVTGGDGMVGSVEEGLEERRRSDSSTDSDFTVVSSVRSVLDADELGWDEIGDSGSSGWKKVASCGSFDRI